MATAASSAPPRDRAVSAARVRYRYMPEDENEMAPICMAKSWPWLDEQYGPSWVLSFLPTWLGAQAWHAIQRVRSAVERATFRFDKLRAYGELFAGPRPPFARRMTDDEHDAAFGWWRVAGANPLVLRREDDLGSLRARIPVPVEHVESRLLRVLGRHPSLAEAARAGRLFVADFELLLKAMQRVRERAQRDSRWRQKYLPAPIGVFVETAGRLVPVAIQIDQPQPPSEHNPVYTPADRWGWIIAKAYFEAADVTYQSGVGHVFGAHLVMEPFCIATPRQLPPRHPVRVLLEPHTRFTLTTNQAAYRYLTDRSKLYDEIYAATLEQLRAVAIEAYHEHGFADLRLEADLARRRVEDAPACYPYRDDLRLWLEPIHEFVRAYVALFYGGDEAVRADPSLQAWKDELTDRTRGAVRKLVPGDALDSRAKLVDLLAQVLFTAGPGHASQHYSADHYYRYTPAFPAAVYAPPPARNEPLDFARWLSMLPSIDRAADQFRSNTFTSFRYDRFGHYERFALGSLPEAREPIARLQASLARVEGVIRERQAARPFPYEFALPSRVPNSINI